MGCDYNFAKRAGFILYMPFCTDEFLKIYISRLHVLLMYNHWMHAKCNNASINRKIALSSPKK